MIDSAASGAECLPIECLINVGDVNACDLFLICFMLQFDACLFLCIRRLLLLEVSSHTFNKCGAQKGTIDKPTCTKNKEEPTILSKYPLHVTVTRHHKVKDACSCLQYTDSIKINIHHKFAVQILPQYNVC